MKRKIVAWWSLLVFALPGCAGTNDADGGRAKWVSFRADGRTLAGYLSLPPGDGPFKAMVFNHGSERQPGTQPELAAFYNRHGFAFFLPHRTGHGRSPGTDIRDRLAEIRGRPRFRAGQVHLLEADNADVAAAVRWLAAQSFVDPGRIVMSGYSFGGIQTLLAAEKGLGVRAFVSFTPAAMSWRNHLLRERLVAAVQNARGPVFLIQAANDFSTGPSEVLGPIVQRRRPPNRAELYPAFGADRRDAHGRFPTRNRGIAIWAQDVLSFLEAALFDRVR